ncbi:MAG: Rrf2 family transcriptional regulator [Melioribacteraceae bacterium]|nr:Rrf2 family transcriptional regulator [Melioribacteraceae bacterium]MCF8393365.1 Rrf2 family transcriptional regulator [Melioribacteraceae bacterium]MCF8418930.1 Rrf2 family transcriptional regulator [Melioribacteraceae bacterium]
MFFHKNVTYGIKAVLYLSKFDDDEFRSLKEISQALRIPKEFTSKVLQSLTQSGIIYSQKGKGGGFRLAKDPANIRIIDVILELDKTADLKLCLFGFKECNFGGKCPMHDSLSRVRDEFFDIIHNHTVKELLASGWFRF